MPENSEDVNVPEENSGNCRDAEASPDNEDSGRYYYDDAFGYVTFVPDDDDDVRNEPPLAKS